MSCILCGRDLHKECAAKRSRKKCCGEASLCAFLSPAETDLYNPPRSQSGPVSDTSAAIAGHSEPGAEPPAGESRSSNDPVTDLDKQREPWKTKEAAFRQSRQKTEYTRRKDPRIGATERPVGRPVKDTVDMTNPEATGRKRAAQMYPLVIDADCEWKGLANVGGGKHPIVGCMGGKQSNRHHGPDKTTTNNDQGNVHRVCGRCHNLWHEWNDADYDPGERHDPRIADPVELVMWDKRETRPKAPISRFQAHREKEDE